MKNVFIALSALSLVFLAGCKPVVHTHPFSFEWSYDENHHWHESTCEHKGVISSKAFHEFGEYVSDNNATTEFDGTMTRTCFTCGYKNIIIDEGTKIHVHNWGEGVVAIPTGCITEGVITFICECGESKNESIAATGHSFGEYVSDNNAKKNEDGTKSKICEKCKYKETVVDIGSYISIKSATVYLNGHDLLTLNYYKDSNSVLYNDVKSDGGPYFDCNKAEEIYTNPPYGRIASYDSLNNTVTVRSHSAGEALYSVVSTDTMYKYTSPGGMIRYTRNPTMVAEYYRIGNTGGHNLRLKYDEYGYIKAAYYESRDGIGSLAVVYEWGNGEVSSSSPYNIKDLESVREMLSEDLSPFQYSSNGW